MFTEQIQPMEDVQDHARYATPSRQHELDRTDHADHTDQEPVCPETCRP